MNTHTEPEMPGFALTSWHVLGMSVLPRTEPQPDVRSLERDFSSSVTVLWPLGLGFAGLPYLSWFFNSFSDCLVWMKSVEGPFMFSGNLKTEIQFWSYFSLFSNWGRLDHFRKVLKAFQVFPVCSQHREQLLHPHRRNRYSEEDGTWKIGGMEGMLMTKFRTNRSWHYNQLILIRQYKVCVCMCVYIYIKYIF